MKNPEKYFIFKFRSRYKHHEGKIVSYPSNQPTAIFVRSMLDLIKEKGLEAPFTLDVERTLRRADVHQLRLSGITWMHYLIPKDSPYLDDVKKIIPKGAIYLKTLRFNDDFFRFYFDNIKAQDAKDDIRSAEFNKKMGLFK